MLVLSRRPRTDQCDVIMTDTRTGEITIIKVLTVVGNQVRFGIEASEHLEIDRREIWERKQFEQGKTPAPIPPHNPVHRPKRFRSSDEEANGNVAGDTNPDTYLDESPPPSASRSAPRITYRKRKGAR